MDKIHEGAFFAMPRFSVFIISLLMLLAAPAWSADDVDAWLAQTTRQVNQIEKKLGLVSLDQAGVDSDVKTLAQVQGRSQKCIDEGNTALAEAQKNLDALGEPVAGEPPEVSKKRRELKKQLNQLKNRINACQLLLIQSGEVAQRLKQRISREVASRLFHRGPGLADVAAGVMAHPVDKPWWDVALFRDEESAAKLSGSDLRSLWLLAGFALLAGLIWRRVLLRRFPAWLLNTALRSPNSTSKTSACPKQWKRRWTNVPPWGSPVTWANLPSIPPPKR